MTAPPAAAVADEPLERVEEQRQDELRRDVPRRVVRAVRRDELDGRLLERERDGEPDEARRVARRASEGDGRVDGEREIVPEEEERKGRFSGS